MDGVIQYANTLLSIVITKLIDNLFTMDMSIKFALASAICGLIKAFVVYLLPHIHNPFNKIRFTARSGSNLHRHLNDLILSEYSAHITSRFISNEDDKTYIDTMIPVNYEYNGNQIRISTGNDQSIILTSKNDLSGFVQNIYTLNSTNIIEVYTFELKNEHSGSWKCNIEKSYKSCSNTFYANDVHEQFINTIDTFIKSENLYKTLGDTYSTGYILYGPPGTGKTSLVKIVAQKYDIPIFIIDMSDIISTEVFIKICNELRNTTIKLKNYIILFEDFDRSGFMYAHNRKVSMSAFLNFLDGVQSAHGRIVIITCNKLEIIKKIPAMIRPGRIDAVVHIGECNKEQIIDTINFRYGCNIDDIHKINITPARLIQLIKRVTYDELMEIFDKYIDFSDIDSVISKYKNKIYMPIQPIAENKDTFDEFLANNICTTTFPLQYNDNARLRNLSNIAFEIDKQVIHQRMLIKVQKFVYDHPDDKDASDYLDKLLVVDDAMIPISII